MKVERVHAAFAAVAAAAVLAACFVIVVGRGPKRPPPSVGVPKGLTFLGPGSKWRHFKVRLEGTVTWNGLGLEGAQVAVGGSLPLEKPEPGHAVTRQVASAVTDYKGEYAMTFELRLPCEHSVGAWLPEREYPDFNRSETKLLLIKGRAGGPEGDTDCDFQVTKVLQGLSPADGGELDATDPTLSWQPFPPANRYVVRCFLAMSSQRVPGPTGMEEEVTGTTFRLPAELAPGDGGTWMVRAYRDDVPIAAGHATFKVAGARAPTDRLAR